jgi:hypothetical protein
MIVVQVLVCQGQGPRRFLIYVCNVVQSSWSLSAAVTLAKGALFEATDRDSCSSSTSLSRC